MDKFAAHEKKQLWAEPEKTGLLTTSLSRPARLADLARPVGLREWAKGRLGLGQIDHEAGEAGNRAAVQLEPEKGNGGSGCLARWVAGWSRRQGGG